MYRYLVMTAVCLLIFSGIVNAQQYTKEHYDELYDSIWNVKQDFERSIPVSDFEFSMDAATFNFKEGDIIFLNTVAGHEIGFYFEGKATCNLVGPTPVEKFSIKKFTGKEDFNYDFDYAVFFISEDLFNKYFSGMSTSPSKESGKTKSKLKGFLDKLEDYAIDVGSAMIPKLYTSKENPYMLCLIDGGKKYVYEYDPTSTESVKLIQLDRKMGLTVSQTITQFFPQEHYQSGGNPYQRDQVDQALPMYYDIDITLEKNTDLVAECKLIYQAVEDSLLCVWFSHSSAFNTDSVKTSDGTSLATDKFKKDDASFTTVFLDKPLMNGEIDTLTFYYKSGDMIKKSPWGDFYLLSPSGWYPHLGYRNKATFTISYKSPEWLTLLSCGEKVKDSVDGDWRYTVWDVNDPVQGIGFNYGWFDSLDYHEDNLPEVKVYRSDASHAGRLFGKDMLETTAKDVEAALQFCINVYGPYPHDKLIVTEIPLSHGQSFPGFLHLAWSSFESDAKGKGFEMDAFRAHEVAHQWWPTIVHFKSYHDQWMSEGFAEYTSAWFMQAKDGDNKRFLKMLKDWKDNITQKGGGYTGIWSEGSNAGPIWLGYRLASTKSEDYTVLVYIKGAYVLHMLRMMLHDYDTHSDSKFIDMMQSFVREYAGRKASTGDFEKLTERYFGMDMNWFFDEWIYGTAIPKYKAKYEVLEENGQYVVQATIKQEDVPDDFKMVVPLVVEFDNSYTVLKFWVDGPETVYKSKPLPYKPKNFILNPYNAVLCHVD